MGAEELRLDGTIQEVTVPQSSFVLTATSFTVPTGKASQLDPPKPKTVVVNAQTAIHVRGNVRQTVAFKDLKPGIFAIVIGQDAGSGKSLLAREVAVWDGRQGAVFRLQGQDSPPVAPATAPPATVPVATVPPATVPPAAVPPAAVPATAPDQTRVQPVPVANDTGLNNIFRYGDFETLDGDGKPAGWKLVDGKSISVVEEEGTHFLRLFSNQMRADVASPILVPLQPQWKRLKVAVRMRTNALRLEPDAGSGARLDCTFMDAGGQAVALGPGEAAGKGGVPGLLLPTLRMDSEWVDLNTVGAIPPGAVALQVAPSLIKARGIADFDDIQVVANPPLDAWPIRAGLPEGTFEQTDDKGNPLGWNLAGWKIIRVAEENGNRFLRLENRTFPNDYVRISSRFKLDPAWQRIKIALRLRTRDLKVGKQPWNEARLWYAFLDENGKEVGAGPFPALKTDSDWVALEVKSAIPKDAVYINLTPAMLATTGVADFDDIQITGNPPLEARPIEDGFPEGTFEQVDAKGNPLGWNLTDSKFMKLVEENGNRFLRIENNTAPKDYVTISNRFKLDPAWERIRVSVRLRGRNLKPGSQPWNEARLWCVFEDENGKEVGTGPLPALKKDSDWVAFSEKAKVPPGAVYLKLTPAMLSTLGVADFDDIVVEPLGVEHPAPPTVALTAEEAYALIAKPTRVTLHVKNAPAQRVLDELSQQSGLSLRLQQSDDDGPLPAVTLDLDNVASWEAIHAVARQLHMEMYVDAPQQAIMFYPDRRSGLRGTPIVHGPILLAFDFADRPQANARPLRAGQAPPNPDVVNVISRIIVDPRLRVGNTRLQITKVSDGQGHSLPAPLELDFGGSAMTTGSVLLPPTLTAGSRLERLKGSLRLQVASKTEAWEVPDILRAKGVTKIVGDVRFTIEELKQSGETYQLQLTLSPRDPNGRLAGAPADLVRAARLRLQDSRGRDLAYMGIGASGGQESHKVRLYFEPASPGGTPGETTAPADSGAPAKLLGETALETQEVEVPFDLTDLRLPPRRPPLVVLSGDEAVQMLGGPNLVTLHFKEAPLQTVLAELSRQAGIELRLWSGNSAETWPAVTIDLDRQPFWEAMRTLTRQLNLRVEWFRPQRALTLRKGVDAKLAGDMVASGPLHLVVNSIERRRDPTAGPEIAGAQGEPGGAIKVSAFVDPRLHVANWGTFYLQEFKADKGEPRQFNREVQAYFAGYPFSTFTIPLPPLPADSKNIALVKGVLRLRVMTRGEVWEVPDILQAKDVSKTVGNERYTITGVRRSGPRYEVHLAVTEADPNNRIIRPLALRFNFLRMVDSQGRDLFRQYEEFISSDGRRARIDFARSRPGSNKEEVDEPVKLLVEIPGETKMIDVPLQLANVALPPGR